jgi:iron complex outermembrane receptor protein
MRDSLDNQWAGTWRRASAHYSLCLALFVLAAPAVRSQTPAVNKEETPATTKTELPAVGKATDLTELPLETLMQMEVPKVFSASKFEQKATEAPASVTVISEEEIKRYGYRTLADVLESAAGFHVSYDRNYSFLGVRGMSLGDFNSRMLVLVNGHRINNSVTDGAYIDNAFLLDIDLIDQVEIIRGPESVLYGNNAFFGVINVVTRTPKQLNGFEVSGEYGDFDTWKGRISFGKVFTNGLSVLLSGTYSESAGAAALFYKEFDTPAQNNGVALNKDGGSYGDVFGSLGYSDFTLEGAFNHREKDNPTAQYYTAFNDPRLRTMDERAYATLKFAHSFPGVVDVNAQVSYDQSDYEIGYPFSVPSMGTPDIFYKEHDAGQWLSTEFQLKKELWERHVLTAGVEYKDDFQLDQRVYDGHTGVTIPGGATNMTRQSYGVYAQGDFQLRTNIHFNGGVRYDRYGDYSGRFNPRLALIYDPFEKSTFKAIYGTAFRAPNFWELTYSGFADLHPEEITSYELVYEQGIGDHLRSSVSGFYNDMKDLIVFKSGTFTNFNAAAKGMELALEGTWAGGWMGRASYTLQQTENRSGGLPLPDSPEHLLKFNLSVPIYQEKIFAGLEVLYTSSRHSLHSTTDVNGQPLTVAGETAPGFPVVNFTLFSRELAKNLEISASIYNVFNEHYSDPASHFHVQDLIAQDGRSFRLKLTYRF